MLDLDRVVFKTEPLYGHLGKGEHVIPDLVGSAPLKQEKGERVVTVHLEIEAQHRASMERRTWRYFSLLNSRYDTDVFSVVVYLAGGPSGVQPRHYRSMIGNVEVVRFTYWAFGLSSCDAEQWLQKPQLLAKALSAMMKIGGDRVEHKLRCLRATAQDKDRGRAYLLNLVIELYLKLRKDEQIRYQAALAEEMSMLPEIPAHIPLSLEEYEARMANHLAETQKQLIVRVLGRRFGAIPEALRSRIETLADPERLLAIYDAAVDATSLSQLEGALARG